VLFSGRFVDRKGIWQLIDAIGIVLAAAPEVRFVLAGGHRGCPAEQMAAWLLPDTLWRTVAAVSS
jgi:glycogen(starch) synthase